MTCPTAIRPPAFGGVVSTAVLAALCAVACGGTVREAPADASTDGAGSTTASPDGAAESDAGAQRDAASSEAGPSGDATPDAGTDAVIDAGSLVTIAVIAAPGPEPNVPIVVDDASGAYLATYSTGPSGTFQGPLPASSTVTVVLGTSDYPNLQSVVGVQPGDVVDFVDTVYDPTSGPSSLTVTSIPMPPPATTQYAVSLGACTFLFTDPPPWSNWPSLEIPGPCFSAQPSAGRLVVAAPLLVEARDDNYALLGFVAQKSVQVPASGGAISVSLAGAWQEPLATAPDVSSAPSGIWATSIDEVVDGTVLGGGIQWQAGTGIPSCDGGFCGGEGVDEVFSVHAGFADSVQGEVAWAASSSGEVVITAVTSAPVPTSSPASLDIDASSIATFPQITGVEATAVAGGGLSIAWSAGMLDAVTGIVGITSWQSPDGSSVGSWSIVSPPTTGGFLASPALGPSASLGPPAGSVFPSTWVYAVTGTALPTYRAVRESPAFFAVSLVPTSFPCTPFIVTLAGPTIPAIPPGTDLTLGVYGEPQLPFGCD